MDAQKDLAELFETHRPHLRSVAYRMLGSLTEAEDAVQEGWLRLSGAGSEGIANPAGWLTTVVARISLDKLRSRRAAREESMGIEMPEPIVGDARDPEREVLFADSVGLALMVVLETLSPAERLAFVLHDMFAMPFDEIAPIIGCSLDAARQHASRARHRVQSSSAIPDSDAERQRQVVEAFLAASREGNFDALLAVLDPDVVLRATGGAEAGVTREYRGARAAIEQLLRFAHLAKFSRLARVNGAPGLVNVPDGTARSVMGIAMKNGKIVQLDVVADARLLARVTVD
jgi:RNA polymerase sigma-70 factor (ECF subfamily)